MIGLAIGWFGKAACAQQYYNVTPDLTTLAKIVAGGLPGGAVVGKKTLMSMMAHRGDPTWDRSQRVAQNGTWI